MFVMYFLIIGHFAFPWKGKEYYKLPETGLLTYIDFCRNSPPILNSDHFHLFCNHNLQKLFAHNFLFLVHETHSPRFQKMNIEWVVKDIQHSHHCRNFECLQLSGVHIPEYLYESKDIQNFSIVLMT